MKYYFFLFLFLTSTLSSQTLKLKAYGLSDPEKYPTSESQISAAQKAAEINLRRQYLFLNGCLIRKIGADFELTDMGHFQETQKITFKTISPLLIEAQMEIRFPENLKKRPLQHLSFELTYSPSLDLKKFPSLKDYYRFCQEEILKTLGKELANKKYLKAETGCVLDYLFIDYTLGTSKILVTLDYLIKK